MLRCREGMATVEMAFIMPPFLVLLFGIIEFGLAFNTRIQATNAAREGARMAVVGIDNWADVGGGTSFWQAVQQDGGLGDLDNCVFSTDDVVGGTLTVTFDYPLDLVIPFIPSPPSWQAGTATATMRIEQLSAPGGPGGC